MLRTGEVAHGTVILADGQTAGKGQRDRRWTSEAGVDLTFSLVLKPEALEVGKQISLSHMAALSVMDVLLQVGVEEVKVKWPNDVMVKEKKIAGILIENSLFNDTLEFAIVGVGMNVGQRDLPEVFKATSLSLVTDQEFIISDLLDTFLAAYLLRYANWNKDGRSFVELDQQLWKKGIWSDFELDGEVVLAKPLAVSDKGHLLIEMENGEIRGFGTERLRHLCS